MRVFESQSTTVRKYRSEKCAQFVKALNQIVLQDIKKNLLGYYLDKKVY